MSLVRRAIPFFVALAFIATAQAAMKPAPKPAPPAAPVGLHGFLLRADEDTDNVPDDVFPRTPSFAWDPVQGVTNYEFELSTSKRFIESAEVWSGTVGGTPAVSIPLALPWMTGKMTATGRDYALYARVRTVSTTGRSVWSEPFGFNMQAKSAPCAWGLTSGLSCPDPRPTYPGLVQWSAVEGATSYEVWWTDPRLNKRISTLTTSADQREYYTLREYWDLPTTTPWRVRAVRAVYGGLPSGLPAVSYGPWSDIFTTPLAPIGAPGPGGQIEPFGTDSSGVNAGFDGGEPTLPHTQTPAFLFAGARYFQYGHPLPWSSPFVSELYRVYVFTDRDCLNQVFASAIVGGPAYSPRTSGPLALPVSEAKLIEARGKDAQGNPKYLRDGKEHTTAMYDQTTVVTSESATAASSSPSSSESGAPPATPNPETPPTEQPSSSSTAFKLPEARGALVDLWDSGWPTGVYWWTVVRVDVVDGYVRDAEGKETKVWHYRDSELPQEACRAGRIRSFGKESDPTLISDNVISPDTAPPFASGLTTDGVPPRRVKSATKVNPQFYGTPLVAWKPAAGAAAYEVQWSKAAYPWSTKGTVFTFGTSALLQGSDGKTLAAGTWYYRVRGLNPNIVSPIKLMSWSKEVPLVVAKPVFTVLKGVPEQKQGKENAKAAYRTWVESGFSVALPSSWRRIATSPSARFYLPKGELNGVSTPVAALRFMAKDPTDKNGTTGVSVLYIPTSVGHGHDTWTKAVREMLAQQSRLVGEPFCLETKVAAGPALKCAYSFRVSGSKLVESEVSYWFDRPTATFVLSLGNLKSANKAKAALRDSIAKKFKITS